MEDRRRQWRGRRCSRARGAEWELGLGWNGEGRSGNAGWQGKMGRRELQRGAHGEVGHGGVAMAAAVARGCASRSSPRLLWASRRRRGAGHVGLGAGRAARAGRAAAAALGRTRSSPSVACASGAARAACALEWGGDGAAQRGNSGAAAGRQQGSEHGRAVAQRAGSSGACSATHREGRESEGEREK